MTEPVILINAFEVPEGRSGQIHRRMAEDP